jgi:glycosyltransferase involved in cell wall biosynthesis
LIYVGGAEKGLAYLALAFLKLKQKYPALELHIYNLPSGLEGGASAQGMILHLFKGMPGCIVHPPCTEKELANAFLTSAICVYPAPQEEATNGLLLMAQAAGCPVVTSTLGALPEIVGNGGVLIPGRPGSEGFVQGLIASLDRLLGEEEYFQTVSKNGLQRAQQYDWKKRAQQFLHILEKSL